MRIARIALLALFGAVVAVGPGLAQQAPAENKGVKTDMLSAFALGAQGLDDYAGREIRMRRITVEPGGVVGLHSHGQRPAPTYILSGTLSEHREGGPGRTYDPGEVITETTDLDHWAENKTGAPVVLISVDLFKG